MTEFCPKIPFPSLIQILLCQDGAKMLYLLVLEVEADLMLDACELVYIVAKLTSDPGDMARRLPPFAT